MRPDYSQWERAKRGYGAILRLALPLIVTSGMVTIQQFVDRLFLTWYSPEAIAAVTPSGILYFTLTCLFSGTVAYANTFVAQYHGSGQFKRIGGVIWQSVYLSVAGGVLLMLLYVPAPYLFRLMGHPAAVCGLEIAYFRLLALGSVPMLLAQGLSAYFSGRGKMWTILVLHVAATGCNIALNYLLIFGCCGLPAMGIRGAGLATVASMCILALLFLCAIRLAKTGRQGHGFAAWHPQAALIKRMLRFGLPAGVQSFLEMITFTAFLVFVGRLGTRALAATNIAFNINTLAFLPMIGLGITISVLVGQHMGREESHAAARITYRGFHLALAYMVVMALGYILLPALFLAPFKAGSPADFADIYAMCVVLLRFVAFYSLFDAMNIVFAFALKGAGDTRFVMLMMVALSLCVFVLPAWGLLLVTTPSLYHLWVLATLFISLLGIAYYLRFRHGSWRHIRLIEEHTPQREIG